MNRNNLLKIAVFICILWSSIYKLDVQPMYLWDESRQANNALEMAESGNVLFSTYAGKPDFWNTKPHLLIAIQAALFKVFGPGLDTLRLPSALAAAGAVFLWFLFLLRFSGRVAGLLFVIIMLCCRGIFVYHVGRTGDYDALLLLFISAAAINVLRIIIEGESYRRIWQVFVWMILAVLTKSLAALIWFPVFGLSLLVFKPEIVKNRRRWLLPASIALSVFLAYYLSREWITPGYIKAVIDNEITGRFLAPNEGHKTTAWYYFEILNNQYFQGIVWFLLLPVATLFLRDKNNKIQHVSLFMAGLFMAIISFSETRIHWYVAPAIPILGVIISDWVQRFLIAENRKLRWLSRTAIIGILIATFFQFQLLWAENLEIGGVHPQYVLQQAEKTGHMPFRGFWLHHGYSPVEDYYSKVFKAKKIEFKSTHLLKFKQADTVYFYQFEYNDSLHSKYHCRQHHAPDARVPVWVFVVDSLKNVSEK